MNYGLIGEKLGHSFSAEIHNLLGLYDYELCPLARDAFDEWMRKGAFRGINVTIPYKKDVIAHLDALSDAAKNCGAVNTVYWQDGKKWGDNTDYFGLASLIDHMKIDLAGCEVLILGTGGTAGTAAALCRDRKAGKIRFVSRTGKGGALTYEEAPEQAGTQVVFNTTPCGMFPRADALPLPLGGFGRLEGVVDVIYNPLKTRLVLEAEKSGVKASGGLWMLVAQALRSAELFTGKEDLCGRTQEVFEALQKKKRNIVLIGMPGCGKTTLGRLLAEKLGRELIDSDEEIVKEYGSIPEIFAAEGEKGFRAKESAVIERLAVRQELVIATGGGAVLKEENVMRLRQNGTLCFLDAPLESLAGTPDRPLAKTRADLERLFRERYDRYLAVCDKRVEIGRDVEKNVKKLMGELS